MNTTVATLARKTAATVDHNHGDIAEVLIHMDLAGCHATFDRTTDDPRVVFSGPKGDHSLSLFVTDRARALAHWQGFLASNGCEWAVIRRATREESYDCSQCAKMFERGQFVTACDFGLFCSGECAEEFRREAPDAAEAV